MSQESRSIVVIMFLLIAVGVIMIYSASSVFADQLFGSPSYFLRRQLFYVILGLMAFAVSFYSNPEFLRRHSKSAVIFAFFLLFLVFIPGLGHSAGGARRWIGFSFFTFQPVEYAKLAICLYLSDYLTRKMKLMVAGDYTVLVPPIAVLLFMLSLVIAQPDLGSTIFILMIAGILFILAGIRFRYVAMAVIPVIFAIVILIIKAPYRMNRIAAYLNPWKDPRGTGFQIIQSFLAFSSGGIKGVGLGQSAQKLFYLPQSYTDFIFSIISEELGLIGALFVLSLYGCFFVMGVRIANKTHDPFYRLLAYSLVLVITLQALINILVTTGLVPTKGLPLPFVSYGGTSLIFNMIAVGLLLAIDRHIVYRSPVHRHRNE